MQAEATSSLWSAKKSAVLASVAFRVLLHAAARNAEQRDLYARAGRDQAAIVATATHHGGCDRRHDRRCRLRPRCRACAVVVDRLVVAVEVAVVADAGAEIAVHILRKGRGGNQ